MISFITKFAEQLIKKPSSTRKSRWLWFAGLYGVALLAMTVIMFFIHGLVALLIAL